MEVAPALVDAGVRPELLDVCRRIEADDEEFKELMLDLTDEAPMTSEETALIIAALRRNTHVEGVQLKKCFDAGGDLTYLIRFINETFGAPANHPSLKRFKLTADEVDAEVARAITEAVRLNPRLDVLHIGSDRVTRAGARILARGLRGNATLRQLSFACAEIEDLASFRAVVDAIGTMTEVWALGLTVDGLDSIDENATESDAENDNNKHVFARGVADLIRKTKVVEVLVVDGRVLGGDEGCRILAGAIRHNVSLRGLDLTTASADSGGDDNDVHSNAEEEEDDDDDNNNNDEDNDEDENEGKIAAITDAGAAELESAIEINSTLVHLDLGRGVMNDARKCRIEALCIQNLMSQRAHMQLKEILVATASADGARGAPLALWPRALELVKAKPDFLFGVLREVPGLFHERRTQRKRKHPEWLRF